MADEFDLDLNDELSPCYATDLMPPLEMCAVDGFLGGALVRMFGGSPQFLLVFYRPDRRENVRN